MSTLRSRRSVLKQGRTGRRRITRNNDIVVVSTCDGNNDGRSGSSNGANSPATIEDFPLELIAAIADCVSTFPHLRAMMLASRRLHHAVRLSKTWRAVDEIAADVTLEEQKQQRKKILLDRDRSILYASELKNMRLLRFLQLSSDEAHFLLPVVVDRLECVRFLMTEFDLGKEVGIECAWATSQQSTCTFTSHTPTICSFLHTVRNTYCTQTQPIYSDRFWYGRGETLKRLYEMFYHEKYDWRNRYAFSVIAAFHLACVSAHRLPVVQYLHETCGVSTRGGSDDDISGLLQMAAGNLPVVKYLRTAFNLTARDVRVNDNIALRTVCDRGHVDVVQYLHTAFGLTANDARADDNSALRRACHNGHLPVVRYLHTAFGLTVEDARADYCFGLRWATDNGHHRVVQYLYSVYGLTDLDTRLPLMQFFAPANFTPATSTTAPLM
eukprot:TRINITY_DN1566_c0_g1_i2.p1 TRINITY_DN1566_c0_g1~~TRINITY_DN1566_c0_g1_i2.p1  ORF type:complete len:440 (+),score=69.64 TRINITY_DN1566_c0_g1_i2:149-1468(+)